MISVILMSIVRSNKQLCMERITENHSSSRRRRMALSLRRFVTLNCLSWTGKTFWQRFWIACAAVCEKQCRSHNKMQNLLYISTTRNVSWLLCWSLFLGAYFCLNKGIMNTKRIYMAEPHSHWPIRIQSKHFSYERPAINLIVKVSALRPAEHH